MPYAYIHYPFENVELFEKNFPGYFVAEGLDQTRGWFVSFLFAYWNLALVYCQYIFELAMWLQFPNSSTMNDKVTTTQN